MYLPGEFKPRPCGFRRFRKPVASKRGATGENTTTVLFLRFTKDAGLVLLLVSDNVECALTALQDIGYRPALPVSLEQFADPDLRERWIRENGMRVFQLWSDAHPETPVDIFVEEPFQFDEEYEKALIKPLYGTIEVRFVTIPTLIQMKQAADREQDRIDIAHLRMRLEDDGQE